MSVKNNTNLSYVDWAKRVDSEGKVDKLVEILSETNEVMESSVLVQSNSATSHRTTIRSGLPTPEWRRLNKGVQPSKSTTVQVDDTMGMLETYSQVDKSLADLNGNVKEFRLSEDKAFIEAMGQEFSTTFIYGDVSVDSEKFQGLAPRFNDMSAENGGQILDGGGTESANTSIWLMTWDDTIAHFIFPKGQKAGLQANDKGEQTDTTNGLYEIYRTHYKWDVGFVVRDWRYIVRIANVDVGDLTKNAATGADLIDLMVQAIELRHAERGKPVFYANRTIRSYLRRQISNKTINATISLENIAGKKVLMFDGIPVRMVDAILNTESVVS